MSEEPAAGTTGASGDSGEAGSKTTYETHIGNVDNSAFAIGDNAVAESMLVLGMAAAIYSKAFLETVAKHHAETLIDAVRTYARKSGKNGKPRELVVGPEDGVSAAKLVITADTPEEALDAVRVLDVTASELRGRELRWDKAAGAWLPVEADPDGLPEAAG